MSRSNDVDAQAPLRLSLNEALIAARFAHGEPARVAVRDQILVGLRAFLPAGDTPAAHARRLADDLREPAGRSGFYAECLATVRRLSRAQRAPSADRIERVLGRFQERVA